MLPEKIRERRLGSWKDHTDAIGIIATISALTLALSIWAWHKEINCAIVIVTVGILSGVTLGIVTIQALSILWETIVDNWIGREPYEKVKGKVKGCITTATTLIKAGIIIALLIWVLPVTLILKTIVVVITVIVTIRILLR